MPTATKPKTRIHLLGASAVAEDGITAATLLAQAMVREGLRRARVEDALDATRAAGRTAAWAAVCSNLPGSRISQQ